MKNYQVVESLAKSTTRILESKEKISPTDIFILKFFRKAGSAGNVREKQVALLEQFIEEMKTINQYMEYSPPYSLQGVIDWAKSQLTRRPLIEVLQSRIKRSEQTNEQKDQGLYNYNMSSFVIRRGTA